MGCGKCDCGAGNAFCFRHCRYCNAKGPQQSVYGPTRPQLVQAPQYQRMAPYLSVFPRCPLMPPPPEGNFPWAQRPPIVWRPQGNQISPGGQRENNARHPRPSAYLGEEQQHGSKGNTKGNKGTNSQRSHRWVDAGGRTVDREALWKSTRRA